MSFKPRREWNPPGKVYWFPEDPTIDNYTNILGIQEEGASPFASRAPAPRSRLKNSSSRGGRPMLALLIGIFTAYGIARFRAGGKMLPFQILQLRMFPPIAIIIPLLFMWVYVGLWNTH